MAAQCAAEGVDHPQYLLQLAELELIDRHQRMVQRRIRTARFPAVKTLDTFDFTAIPPVNKALVMELAQGTAAPENLQQRKLDFHVRAGHPHQHHGYRKVPGVERLLVGPRVSLRPAGTISLRP